MKPQFILNQPEAEYRAAQPALSQSIIKNLLSKSPAHAFEAMSSPHDTAAMKLGRLAHTLILEGVAVFNDRYAVIPECDRRTKEGKAIYNEFTEAAGDRETLAIGELETVSAMQAALQSNSLTKHLFIDGQSEVSAFGKINGVDIKGRFDYYHPKDNVIIDLKTCLDASPEAVKKYILNYGLHIQQYVYAALHKNITGTLPQDFIFVMVEKSAPYGIAVFRIDPEAVLAAKKLVKRGIEIYQDCLQTGNWYGYPEAVQTVNLPAWYYKNLEASQ